MSHGKLSSMNVRSAIAPTDLCPKSGSIPSVDLLVALQRRLS